jgi:hypothetical protein
MWQCQSIIALFPEQPGRFTAVFNQTVFPCAVLPTPHLKKDKHFLLHFLPLKSKVLSPSCLVKKQRTPGKQPTKGVSVFSASALKSPMAGLSAMFSGT